MWKFFLTLFIAAACIAGGVETATAHEMFSRPSFFVPTLVILFVVTGASFVILYRATAPAAFLQSYLLSTVFKLIGYSAYNLVIIFRDRPGAAANVLLFMATYLVFTVVEIAFLYLKFSGRVRP